MKPRNRIVYCILAVSVMTAGFLSRQISIPPIGLLAKYPGDGLWASMLFFALGGIFHRLSTVRLAILSMTLATAVEMSQLYHAGWIDAIRGNFFGHLVLGSSFSVLDIAAYGVGILLGALTDHFIIVGGLTSTRPRSFQNNEPNQS